MSDCVLVVDDNQDSADSLAELLGLWGRPAIVAYNGASALRLAHLHRPKVAVLDLRMPQMDGCELARQLRAEFPGLLLVAMSGFPIEHLPTPIDGLFHFSFRKGSDLQVLEAFFRQGIRTG